MTLQTKITATTIPKKYSKQLYVKNFNNLDAMDIFIFFNTKSTRIII